MGVRSGSVFLCTNNTYHLGYCGPQVNSIIYLVNKDHKCSAAALAQPIEKTNIVSLVLIQHRLIIDSE